MSETLNALDRELLLLNKRYHLAISQAIDLLNGYDGRLPTTHLGHNLANRATDLSELAAKIDQTKMLRNHVAELVEATVAK